MYAIREAQKHYYESPYSSELPHFSRILSSRIADFTENQVYSSGYVIHTLEASFWCFLTTGSYEEAVLKAVNLGEDTDTTGIVTGGLAGICCGLEAIPQEWLNVIVRKEGIARLFEKYLSSRSGRA